MGHIKEPKGVDFIIKSEPLSNAERVAISDFIRQYKEKHSAGKPARTKDSLSKRKTAL